MPVLLALPVGLLAGMSLAWLSRAELARSEVPLALARPFLVAVALGTVVFGPVIGYFAAFHGDWAYLYLVRWSGVPSAVDLVLVILAAAQVPLGFALATPWAMARRGARLLQVAFAIALPVAVACVVASRRLTVSGSYAQYHGAFGVVPIGKSALGRAVLSSWIALSLAYAWSAHVLRTPRAGR